MFGKPLAHLNPHLWFSQTLLASLCGLKCFLVIPVFGGKAVPCLNALQFADCEQIFIANYILPHELPHSLFQPMCFHCSLHSAILCPFSILNNCHIFEGYIIFLHRIENLDLVRGVVSITKTKTTQRA